MESGAIIANKYRVENKLGEGGMGVVVKATELATGKPVAIKWIRPSVASPAALARFEREARAATLLKSENVCRASEVGKLPDGSPYLVMEYVDGEDLSRLIDRRGRLMIREAVDIIMQVCAAMAEAHSAGIVHRDLKPKNIFVSTRPDGRALVKVLDFGISKHEDAQDLHLTRTTEIIGSPSYMSPEQLRASRDVDFRTDIWALGVILFEMLTSEIPFQAEVVTQLVAVVLMEKELSVRSFRPEVPSAIEHVISRCLEKRVNDRFQGVAELAYALAPFVDFEEPMPRMFGETALMLPMPTPSAPLPPTSSRVMVHAGTAVAWGETQMDVVAQSAPNIPTKPRRRFPTFAVVVGALAVMLGTATTGAVYYSGDAAAAAPPMQGSGTDMPLPQNRKDLPPIEPVAHVDPTPTPTVDTSDPVKIDAVIAKTPRGSTQKAPPRPSADPIANVGRK